MSFTIELVNIVRTSGRTREEIIAGLSLALALVLIEDQSTTEAVDQSYQIMEYAIPAAEKIFNAPAS